MNNLPISTTNIKTIIDNDYFRGNVSLFAKTIGFKSGSKIARLFKIDKRTNRYPEPSAEILKAISETFNVTIDWLLNHEKKETINNIKISSNKINGNKNILDSMVYSNDEYLAIIKKQQEQIDELISILKAKN